MSIVIVRPTTLVIDACLHVPRFTETWPVPAPVCGVGHAEGICRVTLPLMPLPSDVNVKCRVTPAAAAVTWSGVTLIVPAPTELSALALPTSDVSAVANAASTNRFRITRPSPGLIPRIPWRRTYHGRAHFHRGAAR